MNFSKIIIALIIFNISTTTTQSLCMDHKKNGFTEEDYAAIQCSQPHRSLISLSYPCAKTILLNLDTLEGSIKATLNTPTKEFLDEYAQTCDSLGNSPLHHAVATGNIKKVTSLKKKYPEMLNTRNMALQTPHMLACLLKYWDIATETKTDKTDSNISNYLKKTGASLSLKRKPSIELRLGQIAATGDTNLIKKIDATHHLDPKYYYEALRTSLLLGHSNTAQKIIKISPNSNISDCIGLICCCDSYDLTNLAIKKGISPIDILSVSIPSGKPHSAMAALEHISSLKGRYPQKENLKYDTEGVFNPDNAKTNTYLHHVSGLKLPPYLYKALLQKKIIVDEQNASGNTALHECADFNNTLFGHLLIKNKANIFIQNKNGRTPLHAAANHYSSFEMAKLLTLQDNRIINYQDNDGDTALHYTAYSDRLANLAQFLLNHNADTTIQNKKGQTALDIAKIKSATQVAKLLIDHEKNQPQQYMNL